LNAARPLDVYRFLRRELDSTYIQLIPIVEPKNFETNAPQDRDQTTLPIMGTPAAHPGHSDSIVTDWSADPETYGYFVSRVFDEWLRKDVGKVMVSQFETLVAQHVGLPSQMCIYIQSCGTNVALEPDGSIHSCDHYVYPGYRLGSVHDTSLKQTVFSPPQIDFGRTKFKTLPRYCRECPFQTDCWGECPRNRLLRTPDGEPGLNYLCSGLTRFVKHAIPSIEKIIADIRIAEKRAIIGKHTSR